MICPECKNDGDWCEACEGTGHLCEYCEKSADKGKHRCPECEKTEAEEQAKKGGE
jgi:DNA modification methylase